MCSGKFYYDLAEGRAARRRTDVALVRLEQLYPLRAPDVLGALSRYPSTARVVWAQEEPRNMGAWGFVRESLGEAVRGLEAVARAASASPASGSATRHRLVQQALVEEALG